MSFFANKCRYLRVRRKNGIIYQFCIKKRVGSDLNWNFCYSCLEREQKPVKSLKKVSKKREFVTERTYTYVLKRDKGKCRLCGTNKDLQLHHINGRGKNKTNNIDNCVMLCSHCHLEVVHKNNKYYRPYLNELIGGKDEINRETIQ